MTGRVLALVPVRSGSKRLANKNLRTLGGKPLLAHAVEHAHEADRIDEVVCSSDDPEMRAVAAEYGARIPFERPEELATDDATNDQVVAHALSWFEEHDEQFDMVCLVPATAPFRTPDDIDAALDTLQQSDSGSVVGVSKYDAPPEWAMSLTEDDRLEPAFGDGIWSETRTQEYRTLYYSNGAVFAAETATFREHGSFYTPSTAGYEMPRERSLDIDEPHDLELARALLAWEDA